MDLYNLGIGWLNSPVFHYLQLFQYFDNTPELREHLKRICLNDVNSKLIELESDNIIKKNVDLATDQQLITDNKLNNNMIIKVLENAGDYDQITVKLTKEQNTKIAPIDDSEINLEPEIAVLTFSSNQDFIPWSKKTTEKIVTVIEGIKVIKANKILIWAWKLDPSFFSFWDSQILKTFEKTNAIKSKIIRRSKIIKFDTISKSLKCFIYPDRIKKIKKLKKKAIVNKEKKIKFSFFNKYFFNKSNNLFIIFQLLISFDFKFLNFFS